MCSRYIQSTRIFVLLVLVHKGEFKSRICHAVRPILYEAVCLETRQFRPYFLAPSSSFSWLAVEWKWNVCASCDNAFWNSLITTIHNLKLPKIFCCNFPLLIFTPPLYSVLFPLFFLPLCLVIQFTYHKPAVCPFNLSYFLLFFLY